MRPGPMPVPVSGSGARPGGATEETPGQKGTEHRSRPGQADGQTRIARGVAVDRVVEAVDGLLGVGSVGRAAGLVGGRPWTPPTTRCPKPPRPARRPGSAMTNVESSPASRASYRSAGPAAGPAGHRQGSGLTALDEVEERGGGIADRVPRDSPRRRRTRRGTTGARTRGCRPGRRRRPRWAAPGRWPRRAPWPGRGWGRARRRWPRGASRRSGR